LWALVKARLYTKKFNNLDELKRALIEIWNAIPVSVCKRLVKNFVKKIKLVKKFGGRKLDRELVRSLQEKEKKRHHWVYNGDGSDSIIERIAYNDIIIRKLIKKHVARIKKEIKLITKEYAPKIKSAKGTKKLFGKRELERMTSSRSSKIINRPDELMKERDQKIHNLEQEINQIVSMDCKQYVETKLGDRAIFKLIN